MTITRSDRNSRFPPAERVGGDHYLERDDVHEQQWDGTVELLLPACRVGAERDALVELATERTQLHPEYVQLTHSHRVQYSAHIHESLVSRGFANNYRVGQKSKRSILSEYVYKTGKIGWLWTNTNIYRENGALSDMITENILRHNCFMFKYSMTESIQWNYC